MPKMPMPVQKDAGFDFQLLQRELDRAKSQVFMGKNAAFLGPLMCSMEFIWSEDLPTAATDGIRIWWNPTWFLKLKPATRQTVLIHELWHPAKMHMLRLDNRDPKVWNWACDININNDLEKQGFTFEGVEDCWKDQQYGELNAEAIYDVLISQQPQCAPWGIPNPDNPPEDDLDMLPLSAADQQKVINNIVKATHSARMTGRPGDVPGEVQLVLNKFLAPKIPWETALYLFFNDMMNDDFSWRRPNRRYQHQDMYLPSRVEDEGRLEHLIYYLDVSGSISDHDVLRFNSEVKYIKDTFNPQRLTLVMFDTRITKIVEFTDNDQFDEMTVVGRGGTHLGEVRQHIMDNNPTAAIIFSDLYCDPMASGPTCPIIWVVVENPSAKVPFGKMIHIKG